MFRKQKPYKRMSDTLKKFEHCTIAAQMTFQQKGIDTCKIFEKYLMRIIHVYAVFKGGNYDYIL